MRLFPPRLLSAAVLVSCTITIALAASASCARSPPPSSTSSSTPSSSSTTTTTTSSGSTSSLRASPAHQQQTKRLRVILDHDGGVEDLIGLLLLLQQKNVELVLVSYVEGDSLQPVATNTTLKLLRFVNRTDVPLAVSTLQVTNPFPLRYRAAPIAADVLPQLNGAALQLGALRQRLVARQPGQDVLTQVLLQQAEPVVIVATGPLTNVAYALRQSPAVAGKISRLWWMGGALRTRGNVFNQSTSDGSAEWNVFADVAAAAEVWATTVPLTLVPLDATNKVPITPDWLYGLGAVAVGQPLISLAANMYAPTVAWVFSSPHDPYFAWDALTVACMLRPDSICRFQETTTQIVTDGPSRGAMRVVGGDKQRTRGGVGLSTPKRVAAAVDGSGTAFDAFVLAALQQ